MHIEKYIIESDYYWFRKRYTIKDEDGNVLYTALSDFWHSKITLKENMRTVLNVSKKLKGMRRVYEIELNNIFLGEVSQKMKLLKKSEFYLDLSDRRYTFQKEKGYKHLSIWREDEDIGRISSSTYNLINVRWGLAIFAEHMDYRMFGMIIALDQFRTAQKSS